jgi:hypothetical protein
MRILLLAALAAPLAYAAEPVAIESATDSEADWADLYKSSFSSSDEQPAAAAAVHDAGQEPLLVTGASLPVRLVFGKPTASWDQEQRPEQLGEDRRASLPLEVEGCKLTLSTGPIQVASYDLLAGQPAIVSDSLPTKSELKAPAGGTLYVSASAELIVELAPEARRACAKRLQGRLVPLGRFGFGDTQLRVEAPAGGPQGQVSAVSEGLAQDVFLLWPLATEAPLVLDAMGPHPQLESGVRKVHAAAAADLYLDVEPRLGRLGDVRADEQRAVGLQAIWGDIKG